MTFDSKYSIKHILEEESDPYIDTELICEFECGELFKGEIMNQHRAGFLFLSLLCVLSGSLYSSLIDQSQTSYDVTADIFSGNSGQTFTAGMDGDLIGVRLLLEGAGYSAPYPYGTDFQVNLRTVSAQNVVSETIIATGYRSKDGIEHNIVKWIEILFDESYHQSEGEKLAFTITELSGGGSNGWNNYGLMSGNPYTGGQQFYSFSGSPLSSSNYDMAFETIVVPEPATLLLMSIGAVFMTRRKTNQMSFRYESK